MERLLDFGFTNIDLWRSEEMQAVQVGRSGMLACDEMAVVVSNSRHVPFAPPLLLPAHHTG